MYAQLQVLNCLRMLMDFAVNTGLSKWIRRRKSAVPSVTTGEFLKRVWRNEPFIIGQIWLAIRGLEATVSWTILMFQHFPPNIAKTHPSLQHPIHYCTILKPPKIPAFLDKPARSLSNILVCLATGTSMPKLWESACVSANFDDWGRLTFWWYYWASRHYAPLLGLAARCCSNFGRSSWAIPTIRQIAVHIA